MKSLEQIGVPPFDEPNISSNHIGRLLSAKSSEVAKLVCSDESPQGARPVAVLNVGDGGYSHSRDNEWSDAIAVLWDSK